VLAIDIGTSSVRASIYDSRLRPHRTAQVRYTWRTWQDGRVEIDAARLERLTAQAIDEALDGNRRPIDAVGTAAFWHSLIGVGPGNRATTAVVPWSDLRADDEAARLRGELDERAVHGRTGCRLHPSYWPARLRWFRKHDRQAFARVQRWMSFPELLEARWLGRRGAGISQASGTGLLLQDSCEWDLPLAEACGISANTLAPLVDLDDEAELSPSLKKRWPALAAARWLPAAGDGALNNIGAGCAAKGRAAVMIGTSGAMRVLWRPRRGERVHTRFGIWRYRLDRSRVVAGGALSNGGNVREWTLGLVCPGARDDSPAVKAIERQAAALAPDAHGLTVLPFLAGTRSPDYRVHATGTIAGLTLTTRPEHLLRAVMESVAYGFAAVLHEMKQTMPVREIVAAGGALERSRAWTQILADALGRPIRLCGAEELTSRGAAAVALEQLGLLDVDALQPPGGRIVQPDAARHRRYVAAIGRYQSRIPNP
jgi:gluconokinase